MLKKYPFAFYFLLLATMTPVWVVLRGFAHLDIELTAAIILPITAVISYIAAARRL